jgi:hypothetical protein
MFMPSQRPRVTVVPDFWAAKLSLTLTKIVRRLNLLGLAPRKAAKCQLTFKG